MIGVTQLINSNLEATDALGLTAATAFTSYQQIASSGQDDGVYYFNDGTRTRQYYFSVDGTAAGQSTGGWARWDTNVDTNYYEGTQCILADSGVASDGTISVRSTTSPTGIYSSESNFSASHGACGVGSNSTYVKASKLAFSDPVFTNAASYYKNSRFQVYKSPETLRSDWRGNQAGSGGTYYPGVAAFPTSNTSDNQLLYLTLNVNNPGASYAPPSTRNAANEASFTNGTYKILEGYEYPLGGTYDILFHFGQINYSGNGYKHSFKLWFKF